MLIGGTNVFLFLLGTLWASKLLDKSTRVQEQVLEKIASTSTSTGCSNVFEYKYTVINF